ncbi:MAG: cupin domain-containing protein, partial [Deltaproteobacteria bacterium]
DVRRFVFPSYEAVTVKLSDRIDRSIMAKALTPSDFEERAEPYLIEIPPKKKLSSHFFFHKGQEIGYVISGRLQMVVDKVAYKLRSGDLIYLTSEIPSQWKNPGPSVARLLWIKLK